MKLLAHKILENNVNSHWWNVAKEKILLDVINSLSLPFEINALEPGVGAGYLLDKLNFKEKFGIDLYACQERSPGFRFIKADAEHLPFKNNAVELLLLIDMLEHVANDEKLIEDCFKILKRNGFMIIFVPALKALWSDLDEIGLHFRRYSDVSLKKIFKNINHSHTIIKSSYINFFLLPFILLLRLMQRAMKKIYKSYDSVSLKKPNIILNKILEFIFSSESFFLKFIDFPIGASYLCVIRKN